MTRKCIKCTNCGSQDFELELSVVPNAVTLFCCKCGVSTPIAVITDAMQFSNDIGFINGDEMNQLYDKAFCENISKKMIWDAHCMDAKQ